MCKDYIILNIFKKKKKYPRMIKRKIDQCKTFFDPSNIFNFAYPKTFLFLKSINQSIKIENDTT